MRPTIDSLKLPMTTRFCLRTLAVLALALTMSACSLFGHKRDNIDTMPVDALYNNAHTSLENADYSAAIKAYQRLIARFPSGDYNEQAQLELAYAQYKDSQSDDAYSTINRFIKTYPANKHVDYAYYLRGLINFDRTETGVQKLVGISPSRFDQGYALQSFDDFNTLIARFPNTPYAADARQRMIFLRNQLAQSELNVARFYLGRHAYVAAADRAKYIVEHYQRSPESADALAVMAKSYHLLGQQQLADQATAVLKLNYPDHPYLQNPKKWPKFRSWAYRLIPLTSEH